MRRTLVTNLMARIRALVALTVALAAYAATPSSADPLEGADPQALDACVSAAGAAREALQLCVGAVARPCLEANGAGTMSDVLCWSAETDAWRAQIAGVTTRVAAADTYRDPARLRAANAAWSAWAVAECEYWALQEGGGSGEQVDRALCDARVSAARAIDLIVLTHAP